MKFVLHSDADLNEIWNVMCKYQDFSTYLKIIFCIIKWTQHWKQSDKCPSNPELNREFGTGGTGAVAWGRVTGRRLQRYKRLQQPLQIQHRTWPGPRGICLQAKSNCNNCAMFWKWDCSFARALGLIRAATAVSKGKYDPLLSIDMDRRRHLPRCLAWASCWQPACGSGVEVFLHQLSRAGVLFGGATEKAGPG